LPIEAAEDVGDLATTYLLTYLLPFIAIAQPSARDLAAYVLAFVVFALVYVRSDMQQVNPLLYAFGRRITKVTTAQKRTLYAISKHRVIPGEICGVELTSGVFLVTKESAA
jgi:hypothetical protein